MHNLKIMKYLLDIRYRQKNNRYQIVNKIIYYANYLISDWKNNLLTVTLHHEFTLFLNIIYVK